MIFFFPLECTDIQAVSDNRMLLPTANISLSSGLGSSFDNISDNWCAFGSPVNPVPHFNLFFTQPVNLLYFTTNGDDIRNFSFAYENHSGDIIAYSNVDSLRVSKFNN